MKSQGVLEALGPHYDSVTKYGDFSAFTQKEFKAMKTRTYFCRAVNLFFYLR